MLLSSSKRLSKKTVWAWPSVINLLHDKGSGVSMKTGRGWGSFACKVT